MARQAQCRDSGKRSSFYSDYTFGVWTDRDGTLELVPVGKAYFGFTDQDLVELGHSIRNHTRGALGAGTSG